MSDKFFSFIETKGKTAEEIRQETKRAVERAVSGASKSVIDPSPEKIPPRESIARPERPQARRGSSGRDRRIYTGIEEFDGFDTHEAAEAGINERILGMRALAARLSENTGGRPFRDERLRLVTEGDYMADVEDDYERSAFCGIYRPIYDEMNNAQLRTYFTWRTDARRGVYNRTDPPYVRLYSFELLNKIGVASSADAFAKLLDMWKGCRAFAPFLDDAMPHLVRDFYIFNNISEAFPDLGECLKPFETNEYASAIKELFEKNYAGKLQYFVENSAYKITASIFYTDKHTALIEGALEYALCDLDKHFTAGGLSLFEPLCGRIRRLYDKHPFSGAFVDLDRMDCSKPSRGELFRRYVLKNNEHVLEQLEKAPCRVFIGYILKSVEAALRDRTGFRRKLTINDDTALADFKNREKFTALVSDAAFAGIIPAAVDRWCAEHRELVSAAELRNIAAAERRANSCEPRKPEPPQPQPLQPEPPQQPQPPREVVIDMSKLARIREEADVITEKLILDDERQELPEAPIESMVGQIEDDYFSERAAAYGEEFVQRSPDGGDVWQAFADSLSAEQKELLCGMLQGGSGAAICRERGLFPETVFEGINAAALELVGDVVIENGELLEDYISDIRLALDM